jgi:hypothetical protein
MRKGILVIAAALALGSLPAEAGVLYSDGPLDGQTIAWTINFGFQVADSFTLSGPSTLTGADFGIWNFTGDQVTSVDWAILTGSPGAGGSVLDNGTASTADLFLFHNQDGYDVYTDSIGLPNINLAAGTYWIELQNASASNGDPAYWDMNGGPSQAWESALGSVTPCPTYYYPTGECSSTFDITGTARAGVPEPASLALLGAGIAGFGAFRRKKSA